MYSSRIRQSWSAVITIHQNTSYQRLFNLIIRTPLAGNMDERMGQSARRRLSRHWQTWMGSPIPMTRGHAVELMQLITKLKQSLDQRYHLLIKWHEEYTLNLIPDHCIKARPVLPYGSICEIMDILVLFKNRIGLVVPGFDTFSVWQLHLRNPPWKKGVGIPLMLAIILCRKLLYLSNETSMTFSIK